MPQTFSPHRATIAAMRAAGKSIQEIVEATGLSLRRVRMLMTLMDGGKYKPKADRNWKRCNCAGCGLEMLGISHSHHVLRLRADARAKLPPLTAGYHNDRPYCAACIRQR